jgi:hypothetical protein
LLAEHGFSEDEIAVLINAGTVLEKRRR